MIVERDKTTGTFTKGNAGGPGRGRTKELLDRYKCESAAETLAALAGDVEKVEARLGEIDVEIERREAKYLQSVEPLVREKARLVIDRGRCHAARVYLESPTDFTGERTPLGVAETEYRAAVEALRTAEVELARWPEVVDTPRSVALLDPDGWERIVRHEQSRDEVDRLLGVVQTARRKYEGLGGQVPQLPGHETEEFPGMNADGPDPFDGDRPRRRSLRRDPMESQS